MARVDYSIDIETTGLIPGRHAMIQIAGVRFNMVTGEVDKKTFNGCLSILPHLHWDEGTRTWWMGQSREILQTILSAARPPRQVLEEFCAWVVEDGARIEERFFWGKNAGFDWQFYVSHLNDVGLGNVNPFSFRNIHDVKQFLRDRCFPNDPPEVEHPKSAQAHNALVDAILQAGYLHNCYKATV